VYRKTDFVSYIGQSLLPTDGDEIITFPPFLSDT